MSSSSSTTHVKKGKQATHSRKHRYPVGRFQAFLTYILVVMWLFLMSVGIATLLDPDWLDFLSAPEKLDTAMKIEEAGSNMMDRGNLAEAEKLFKQALEIKPDFGNAMVGLGQVYSKMGKEDQAIEMFSKGLHNEPLLPDLAYGNLGAIYENRGESENALKYYKKAAETAPEPTGALVNIGRLYIEMNRPDSAEIVLRRALYNLSDMKIANRASMIFAKRFRRNNPEEVEFIEEKLKKGITEEDVSIYDKEMFLQSRMYSPRAVAIYHLLGVALAMTGKFDEGIEHIRKGLEIQPDNPDIKHDLQTAIAEKERAGI